MLDDALYRGSIATLEVQCEVMRGTGCHVLISVSKLRGPKAPEISIAIGTKYWELVSRTFIPPSGFSSRGYICRSQKYALLSRSHYFAYETSSALGPDALHLLTDIAFIIKNNHHKKVRKYEITEMILYYNFHTHKIKQDLNFTPGCTCIYYGCGC